MRSDTGVGRVLAALALAALLLAAGCKPALMHGFGAAVGTEALWMINMDGTVGAIDGLTGRPFVHIDLNLDTDGVFDARLAGDAEVLWVVLRDGRLFRIDPRRARTTAQLRIPAAQRTDQLDPTFAHHALWINQHTALWRVAPNGTVAPIALPAGVKVRGLADDSRGILAFADDGRLLRIDATGTDIAVLGTSPALRDAKSLTVTSDGLLAARADGVTALDPDTAATRWTAPLPGAGGMFLATDGSATWLAGDQETDDAGHLTATAVAIRHPAPAPVPLGQVIPSSPVVVNGTLWLGDELNMKLLRLDPDSTVATTVDLIDPDDDEEYADLIFTILAGRTSVWALDTGDGYAAFRVDLRTNAVTRLRTPDLSVYDVIVVDR
jgi:hypothetical protein